MTAQELGTQAARAAERVREAERRRDAAMARAWSAPDNDAAEAAMDEAERWEEEAVDAREVAMTARVASLEASRRQVVAAG